MPTQRVNSTALISALIHAQGGVVGVDDATAIVVRTRERAAGGVESTGQATNVTAEPVVPAIRTVQLAKAVVCAHGSQGQAVEQQPLVGPLQDQVASGDVDVTGGAILAQGSRATLPAQGTLRCVAQAQTVAADHCNHRVIPVRSGGGQTTPAYPSKDLSGDVAKSLGVVKAEYRCAVRIRTPPMLNVPRTADVRRSRWRSPNTLMLLIWFVAGASVKAQVTVLWGRHIKPAADLGGRCSVESCVTLECV